MSILKYKDPKTGEFKRINPYKADLSFVGKDGITVNKAADSEKVEISGSGCVQKYSGPSGYRRAYITDETNWDTYTIIRQEGDNSANTILQRKADGSGEIVMPETPIDLSITNKKYVADNYVEKVKFTNLEQALNGYILDTAKEAYADLDSAVLKDSVAVGDNVYPIADKTRALVTRIEGKTTKMVQLLDKSTFPATKSVVGLTVTKTDDGGLHVLGTTTGGGGRNSWDITVKIEKGHRYLSLLKGNKKLTAPIITSKSDLSQYFSISDIVTSTIEGECNYGFNVAAGDYDETIYLNLFDLTAMNREDITTVEQFKAEFPDLYPYENGNIYPAKISGVKFYENQDKSGEQVFVTLPETYDLHGIGDYKDYLEIAKNENNELYTLKKVQSVGVHEYTGNEAWTMGTDNLTSVLRYYCTDIEIPKSIGDKGICNKYATLTGVEDKEGVLFGSSNAYIYLFLNKTNFPDINSVKSYLSAQYAGNNPVVIYYRLSSPVETVIATNLTYEQVTAIRHNGGLIEVEGNTNKGCARPTVTNTIVYRLTAANTAEG